MKPKIEEKGKQWLQKELETMKSSLDKIRKNPLKLNILRRRITPKRLKRIMKTTIKGCSGI